MSCRKPRHRRAACIQSSYWLEISWIRTHLGKDCIKTTKIRRAFRQERRRAESVWLRYRLGDRGIVVLSSAGEGVLLFPRAFKPALKPNQSLIYWIWWCLSSGLMRLGCEAHFHLASSEGTPPFSHMPSWRSQGQIFTFIFSRIFNLL